MPKQDSSALNADLVQLLQPIQARSRAMFGGYGVYVDEKIVALVNDNAVFLKRSDADEQVRPHASEGFAYLGAKATWRIDEAAADDGPLICELVQAVADALPVPKPKRR